MGDLRKKAIERGDVVVLPNGNITANQKDTAEYRYANDPAFKCLVHSLEQAKVTPEDLEQAAIVMRGRVRVGRAIDEFGVDQSALKSALKDARKKMDEFGDRAEADDAPEWFGDKMKENLGRTVTYRGIRNGVNVSATISATITVGLGIPFDAFCMTKLAHVFNTPLTKPQSEAMLAVDSAMVDRRLIVVPLERGRGKTSFAIAAAIWANMLAYGRVIGFAANEPAAIVRSRLSWVWRDVAEVNSFDAWRSILGQFITPRPDFVVIDDPMTHEVHNSPSIRAQLIQALTRDIPALGGPGGALAGVIFAPPDLCRELVDLGPWTLTDSIPERITGSLPASFTEQTLHEPAIAPICTCGGTMDAHRFPCPHWKA